MKRATKKPLSIVLVIFILVCMALPKPGASAVDFLDGDKTMKVEVKYGDSVVRDTDVGICRVATISVGTNGKVRYILTPEFATAVDAWSEDMDNISAAELRELAAKLASFARNNDIERVVESTDVNGAATFNELKNGLYLVMQENTGSRRYTFAPSLASVGREGVIVTVKPKVEPTRPPTTPPTITVTPTPTDSITVSPTPTPTTIITPTQPPGDDIDITPTEPPTTDFPPDDGDKPDKDIIQTGVFNFDVIIIALAVAGVMLLVIGIVQNRRSQREKEQTGSFLH